MISFFPQEVLLQANLGFAAQYAATNTDPITNLTDHLKVLIIQSAKMAMF